MAGQRDENGLVGAESDIEWQLRRPVADDLCRLESLGIMEQADSRWYVVHFATRQARKLTDSPAAVNERVRAYRERQCNAHVTPPCNAHVTPGVTPDVTPDVTPGVTPRCNATEENRVEENRVEENRVEPTAAAAAPEPELDKDFGAVWSVYAYENLVNPSSHVQQEDISDMVKRCRDPDTHREAIKRAKRLNNRPSLNLIFKILGDYVETGAWDIPGGNGKGPPGKGRPASRETSYDEADLERQRKRETASGWIRAPDLP
jgi:hypothetical protein